MQVVVLAGFIIALSLLETGGQEAPAVFVVASLAGYVAVAGALGVAACAAGLRALRGEVRGRPPSMRAHNLLMILAQCWLVLALAALITAGYGQLVTERLALARVPLAGEAAAVAPFVAGIMLVWVAVYPFHRCLRRRLTRAGPGGAAPAAAWSLGQFLSYNLRHHVLLIAVPIGLIVAATDSLRMYVVGLLPVGWGQYVIPAGMVVSAGVVLLCAPAMIVRIWRTEPMGDCPLRRGLEEMSAQMGLRYRSIHVWRSDGVIANAGVMGLVAPLRYVLISDGLIDRMSLDEIRGIFAHEAGHMLSHHILYYVLFAVAGVTMCTVAGEAVAYWAHWPPWAGQALVLVLLAGAWGGGFGWLSRRFERQCDIFAAWALDRPAEGDDPIAITWRGAGIFAAALQRVAALNGIPLRQRNWRHGSIASRVGCVLQTAGSGAGRRAIDRLVRRVKVCLWGALATAIGAAAWIAFSQAHG